jgi:monoterpene epsilon-lactone hydrolase
MKLFSAAAGLALGALAAGPVFAAPVPVDPTGATSIPETEVPSSALMSAQGNASRVEHIRLKRAFKGRPTDELYRGVFGPGLERMQAAFPVISHKDVVAGVPVIIYEPRAGVAAAKADRVLIDVHGGGFQACFAECGGMESIPLSALTGLKVISIDYREGPGAHYPEATQDVVAVYRELLKTISPGHVVLYGCSAGGLLTAQSLAWFADHALPMPAAAGVFCAGGDAGMGGDSRIIGSLLGDGETSPPPQPGAPPAIGYMAGASPTDRDAYPARDPAVLAKFPPMLVITGTRDFAMSSAVNFHSKLVAAGVDARLHMWEGGRHAFFYDERVPEAREAYAVMARFFTDHLR